MLLVLLTVLLLLASMVIAFFAGDAVAYGRWRDAVLFGLTSIILCLLYESCLSVLR